jgi:multiple sugar transport system ATP-binding protein
MDEQLSNLDAKLRVEMRAAVSRLQQNLGTTTVYVTHDQTEAMTLGDRVAVMRAGILQQVAGPRELYENPRNLFVAGFIGSPAMNFFSGTIEGDVIHTPMGDVPLHESIRSTLQRQGSGSRNVIVGVRPEDFEDAQFAPEGHDGYEFEAPIELTESMGSEIYAHFDFGEQELVESEDLRELQEDAGTSDVPSAGGSGHAVARVDASSGVTAGQRSRLWLDIAKLHLFDPSDGSSLTRRDDTVTGTGTHAGNGDAAPAPPTGGPPPPPPGGGPPAPPGDRVEGGATSMGETPRTDG